MKFVLWIPVLLQKKTKYHLDSFAVNSIKRLDDEYIQYLYIIFYKADHCHSNAIKILKIGQKLNVVHSDPIL